MSVARTALRRRSAIDDEHRVAALVADGVVDQLELVEVAEQHGQHRAAAALAGERHRQAVLQERAVGKAGEGIVQGQAGSTRATRPAWARPNRSARRVSSAMRQHERHDDDGGERHRARHQACRAATAPARRAGRARATDTTTSSRPSSRPVLPGRVVGVTSRCRSAPRWQWPTRRRRRGRGRGDWWPRRMTSATAAPRAVASSATAPTTPSGTGASGAERLGSTWRCRAGRHPPPDRDRLRGRERSLGCVRWVDRTIPELCDTPCVASLAMVVVLVILVTLALGVAAGAGAARRPRPAARTVPTTPPSSAP